ncbi:MAG: histidinol-phosphatase HisJ family protein [Clostridia bacterium]|nr:histidinol-phosphatase HisJ family protein [Clostridia bacterium]
MNFLRKDLANAMKLFNTHTHTNNSVDCKALPIDMCKSAINAGLSGIAFCDHCHGGNYITHRTYSVLKGSMQDAKLMASQFEGSLEVLAGAEFDEILWSPEYINRLIESSPLDIVLASVHRVRTNLDPNYISRVNFSAYTNTQLREHAKSYFEDVLETAEKCDFDVLSHLTLILRYVRGSHKLDLDLAEFMPIIDKTLKVLISREKALELNSSEFENIGFMPDAEILKRYRSFGGELVTIGTVAHKPKRIDYGICEAVQLLKDCGFDSYYYYKNRQPQKISFE